MYLCAAQPVQGYLVSPMVRWINVSASSCVQIVDERMNLSEITAIGV